MFINLQQKWMRATAIYILVHNNIRDHKFKYDSHL